MTRLAVAWFAILAFCGISAAQTLRLEWKQNYASFQLSGPMLRGHEHFSNEALDEDFDFTSDISALQLDNVLSGPTPPAYFVFFCKDNSRCIRNSSHTCQYKDPSFPQGNCPSEFTSESTNGFVSCGAASYQECEAFLKAVRAAATSPPSAAASRTQASPERVRASAAPVQAASPPVTQPGVEAQTRAASDLHDLLASMGWLSNSNGMNSGNNALDQLLRNIKPTQTPPQKRAQLPHFTFAAFAQAGGFDANGAWGVGTGADLNSAIGAAENTCHQGATICGDEGYCVLRPGLWGAWASDLQVAGNSAFTCNLATEEAARAQAQAWCGDGCKVLWSGAGQ